MHEAVAAAARLANRRSWPLARVDDLSPASLGARQAYLDGELCGLRPDGITSFSMIQTASDSSNAAGLVYFLFDLL